MTENNQGNLLKAFGRLLNSYRTGMGCSMVLVAGENHVALFGRNQKQVNQLCTLLIDFFGDRYFTQTEEDFAGYTEMVGSAAGYRHMARNPDGSIGHLLVGPGNEQAFRMLESLIAVNKEVYHVSQDVRVLLNENLTDFPGIQTINVNAQTGKISISGAGPDIKKLGSNLQRRVHTKISVETTPDSDGPTTISFNARLVRNHSKFRKLERIVTTGPERATGRE